jgi:FixJ family two-component response regulator
VQNSQIRRICRQSDILSDRRSVFVVDDDPSMLRGIKRLLRAHGFHSMLFASPSAMLTHDDFEDALCFVLDIDLNGESGFELCQCLVSKGIRLPVIYITGNDSDANRAAAIESGCIAYLTKPFTALSLIKPIENVRAAAA